MLLEKLPIISMTIYTILAYGLIFIRKSKRKFSTEIKNAARRAPLRRLWI